MTFMVRHPVTNFNAKIHCIRSIKPATNTTGLSKKNQSRLDLASCRSPRCAIRRMVVLGRSNRRASWLKLISARHYRRAGMRRQSPPSFD